MGRGSGEGECTNQRIMGMRKLTDYIYRRFFVCGLCRRFVVFLLVSQHSFSSRRTGHLCLMQSQEQRPRRGWEYLPWLERYHFVVLNGKTCHCRYIVFLFLSKTLLIVTDRVVILSNCLKKNKHGSNLERLRFTNQGIHLSKGFIHIPRPTNLFICKHFGLFLLCTSFSCY